MHYHLRIHGWMDSYWAPFALPLEKCQLEKTKGMANTYPTNIGVTGLAISPRLIGIQENFG